MFLSARKLVLAWVLSVLMVFALVGGAYAFSNILAFGDSLSDNGYLSDGYGAIAKTNDGDGDGEGDVWVEYLADIYGATLLDMAYSGATTGYDNPALAEYYSFWTYTGLQSQVALYAANYGTIADDTLVTISAGGNDMFQGRSAVDAANNIQAALISLIAMGGDTFMVMNLSTSQQSDEYTEWMELFNETLAANIAALSALYGDVEFILLDMNEFVAQADNYTGTWLAADDATRATTTFAWYDIVGVHPTTEVHQQIAEYAAATAAPVPEPATVILLLSGLAGLAGIRRKKK